MSYDQVDNRRYVVLMNDEHQYALWPKKKRIPSGWRSTDKEGSKTDCSTYVDSIWTDMRPRSLRLEMGAQ